MLPENGKLWLKLHEGVFQVKVFSSFIVLTFINNVTNCYLVIYLINECDIIYCFILVKQTHL